VSGSFKILSVFALLCLCFEAYPSQSNVDAQLQAAIRALATPTDSLAIVSKLESQSVSMTKAQQASLDYVYVVADSELAGTQIGDDLKKTVGEMVPHANRLAGLLGDLSVPDGTIKAITGFEKSSDRVLPDSDRIAVLSKAVATLKATDTQKDARAQIEYDLANLENNQPNLVGDPDASLSEAEQIAKGENNNSLLLKCDALHEGICTSLGLYQKMDELAHEILAILAKDPSEDDRYRYLAPAEASVARAAHYLGDLPTASTYDINAFNDAMKAISANRITPQLISVAQYAAYGLLLIFGNERDYTDLDTWLSTFKANKYMQGTVFKAQIGIAQAYVDWRQRKYSDCEGEAADLLQMQDKLPDSQEGHYYSHLITGSHVLAETYLGKSLSVESEADEIDRWFQNWGKDSKDSIIASALHVRCLIGCGCESTDPKIRNSYFNKAAAIGDEFLTRFEAVLRQVTDPEDTSMYQETVPHPYGHLAWLEHLMASDGDVKSQELRAEAALAYVERGRGKGLERQQMSNVEKVFDYFNPDERQELSDQQNKLGTAYHNLQKAEAALHGDPNNANIENLRKDVSSEEQNFKQLLERVFNDHDDARLKTLQSRITWNADSLQNLLAEHRDTLYLSYSLVDEDRSMLIAAADGLDVRSFELPVGEAQWIGLANQWTSDIRGDGLAQTGSPSAIELKDARGLYEHLLDPIEKAGLLSGKYKKIVIVSEGAIATVPFGALLDANGKRLATRFTISYAESLGLLTVKEQRKESTENLLCVADPTQVLAGSAKEGAQIVDMFKGRKLPFVNLLSDTTVTTIEQVMPKYAILHFACDGYLSRINSSANGLLLSGSGGTQQILYGSDIMWSRMSAAMVVLAACDTASNETTAVSEFNGGDGVQGLAWCFEAADCPTVVASRWRVSDLATADLMVGFYKSLFSQKMTVAEALKQAELQMIRSGSEKSKPYYWAAFDVYGNGDATEDSFQLRR
jgi:CHAT domain-containing protein